MPQHMLHNAKCNGLLVVSQNLMSVSVDLMLIRGAFRSPVCKGLYIMMAFTGERVAYGCELISLVDKYEMDELTMPAPLVL